MAKKKKSIIMKAYEHEGKEEWAKPEEEKPLWEEWWALMYPPIITAIAVVLLGYMFFKITAKALYRSLIGKLRKEANTEVDPIGKKGEKQ